MNSTSMASRPKSGSNSPLVVGNRNQTPSPRSSTSEMSGSGKYAHRTSLLPQLFASPQLNMSVAMQYVLQRFFEIQDASLAQSLRAVDLIVDQTYAESLSLRQLNDSFSNKQYRYFNTVSRNKQVSKCPIFCIAAYAAARWGDHRNGLSIRFEGFQNVPLLGDTSSFAALAASQVAGVSPSPGDEPSPSSVWGKEKTVRTLEPPEDLINFVFPWLHDLQDDLETKDRTNYNLHSLCELFEFLARVLIQDMAFLSCTNELPSLLSNILEYVPKLESSSAFKQFKSEMQRQISSRTTQSEWSDRVLSRVEESYIEISRRFVLHNQSLSEEIRELKSELRSMKQLISELLSSQRQFTSYSIPNGTLSANGPNSTGTMGSVEKNALPTNLFNNLVSSAEDAAQTTPSLAPINMFHSLSSSAVPETQRRKLPLPNHSGFSPPPIGSPFKRFKFDDPKSNQQQNNLNATLDSLLSKAAVSPRLTVPSLNSGPVSSQLSPQFNSSDAHTQLLLKKPPSSAVLSGGSTHEVFKYKLSRENKTIWDLYTEWYVGLNGKPSIKSLIDTYGWRRWKVSEDSHFFPTRRIIIDYIEREIDRGLRTGRFLNTDREAMRKVITDDLEKFRAANGLTLNSISMYFRNLTRKNTEICIYDNFQDWSIMLIDEEEKNKYCKRQQNSGA
ncbi:LAQU0S16e02344g1_1 [Lachancea quebecensis]|uniref:LAQU0S16e02344g1_1 n=1 Tax=Lachancea quebecensis TaxID=1654605 RepID=A0A0N7MM94_9SACH|nr:LAQU0S16e02344g1_1 [Lachancea quebecensis]